MTAQMTANINQDGVDQCTARMREAISQGDKEKAQKFMEKAVRLGADPGAMRSLLTAYLSRQAQQNARNRSGGSARRRANSRRGTTSTNGAATGGATAGQHQRPRAGAGPTTAGAQQPRTAGATANARAGGAGAANNPTSRGGAAPNSGGSSSSSSSQTTRPTAAGRAGTSSSASAKAATQPKREYTPEQMQLVQKILRTKDFYALMGLTKTASVDEIKKAYKKLALKLHPDKNGAPGAEEAFKKLSKAVQCLEDTNKRRIYDQCGDPDRAEQQTNFRQEEFMTANDFFDMFFNGGRMQQQNRHPGGARGAQRQQQQAAPEDVQRQQLLNLLPLLFVILTALTSSGIFQPRTHRVFSLTRDSTFQVEQKTSRLKAQYFVHSERDFNQQFPKNKANRLELEEEVEMQFIRSQQSECEYQEKKMWKRVMQARKIADPTSRSKEMERAKSMPKTSCDKLETIKSSHPKLYHAATHFFGGMGGGGGTSSGYSMGGAPSHGQHSRSGGSTNQYGGGHSYADSSGDEKSDRAASNSRTTTRSQQSRSTASSSPRTGGGSSSSQTSGGNRGTTAGKNSRPSSVYSRGGTRGKDQDL
ncbi:unnamed protein product [Amoebophrya sp. A120]|nr:unnamed protein product [Amoebophrya sp. A120]|eukprot:GSA120T00004319001.1